MTAPFTRTSSRHSTTRTLPAYWARAIDEKIADMAVKVISCEDQVGRLSRSSLEKHRRDVELLKAVCPEHAPAS